MSQLQYFSFKLFSKPLPFWKSIIFSAFILNYPGKWNSLTWRGSVYLREGKFWKTFTALLPYSFMGKASGIGIYPCAYVMTECDTRTEFKVEFLEDHSKIAETLLALPLLGMLGLLHQHPLERYACGNVLLELQHVLISNYPDWNPVRDPKAVFGCIQQCLKNSYNGTWTISMTLWERMCCMSNNFINMHSGGPIAWARILPHIYLYRPCALERQAAAIY